MPYTIRTATVEDLGRVEQCARRFYASSRFLKGFRLEVFEKTWTGILAADFGVLLLLECGAEIVGAIGGVAYPDPNSGELLATEFFWFVEDGHRGRGLELYRRFEAWARERDCKQINMGHLADLMDEKHRRVYAHLGFEMAEYRWMKEL